MREELTLSVPASVLALLRDAAATRGGRGDRLAVTLLGAHLSLVETPLRADHISVAGVEGQGVRPRRLSLHDPLDLDLSHAVITFLRRCSARITRLMMVPGKDACNQVLIGSQTLSVVIWEARTGSTP